ncbi:hypothetical protein DRE_02620 [Drechslerella stenobrocha 248]|uniref:Uncharacterized protein n=1 Tax=Drechslerella stenobrocha 248 TaxID=1043628 RepID=W7HV44_9PEZI|nr:hypothetical protein DRE_02620 [Drechslerella stenobrocha 248]
MADESSQEFQPPPTVRRPTDHELSFRPNLTRKPSDLLPPPKQGQFTPELSPLDAFVSRGRQLYRQLELEERELRKQEESRSPDAFRPPPPQQQQQQQQQYQSQQPHGQFLHQPPKFIRSHSAGAEQQLGVGTLNAAVEQWAIGNSKSHTGGDRATKFFTGRSPANGGNVPQVSVVHSPGLSGSHNPVTTPGAQSPFFVKESGFRPVSQHPRISGVPFEDDMSGLPRASQHIVVDRRGSSVNRSTASSPRSPRMPFTSDDDSSDEEDERRRRRESARRRDLERRAPVLTGKRSEPSPVREEGESSLLSLTGDESRQSVSGLPQRSFSGASPVPKPMDAVEQARKGSFDSNPANRNVTPTFQPRISGPSSPSSPSRFTQHSNQHHTRKTSGLAAPSLPVASTSTPNLVLRSNAVEASPHAPRTAGEPTISSLANDDDVLFLPPQPAFAKSAPNTPRPSSAMSDTASIYSVGGTKRAFNFSRPMSKTSFYTAEGEYGRSPSMEMQRPGRTVDSADYGSFVDEMGRTDEENFGDNTDMRGPSSFAQNSFVPRHRATGSGMSGRVGPTESYTYSMYSLPRGRQVDRSSVVFFDGERHRFEPEGSDRGSIKRADSNGTDKSISPSTVPTSPFAALHTSQEGQRPPLSSGGRAPEQQQQQLQGQQQPPTLGRSLSGQSGESLRPRTSGVPKLSAEEHLNIAIPLHEKGSYAKSTYHFRLSAMGGNTTGMLMYALALRHGWGVRANPSEAFNWLRKAATLAQEEMASAEKDPSKPKPTWWESKSMRSKFALTTYELGMSYTNGWGCAEDKSLGLQYFEIAASWGDVDALSEAGYAYANGQGCKKDLKKSAKYYRQASENGVSMVGNSWIWKDKYDDDEDKAKKSGKGGKDKGKESEKDKAGLLSFSRKKSVP